MPRKREEGRGLKVDVICNRRGEVKPKAQSSGV